MSAAQIEWTDGAVPRVARKPWRCRAADEILGYRVLARYTTPHGSGETTLGAPTLEEAERIAAEKLGTVAARNMNDGERPVAWYEDTEVVPRINPNYASRAADCAGDILPGDRYVEFLGESMAWESGYRYCWACGVKVWAR